MAYSKTNWIDDLTPLSATNMNKIETILGELGNVTHEIATQVEAEAGTSNSKYMTPLRVNEAINANALTNKTDVCVVGSYVGDGVATRTFVLGFKPQAVLIINNTGVTTDDLDNGYGGLAIDGSPLKAPKDKSVMVEISADGFTMYYSADTAIRRKTNELSMTYNYIAYK